MAAEQSEQLIWMRPERSATGRPAQRSRSEITAIAMGIADREGLDAVSMRRVAAQLGTGAASLYRYVDTREDLLDLMADATGAEYQFIPPTGDWLADLIAIGQQTRAIMRRHPWLAPLAASRGSLGPNGLRLIEAVLEVLNGHPAAPAVKMEAFAIFTSVTASFVQHELGGGSDLQRRNVAYVTEVLASGERPRLAELLSQRTGTTADDAAADADPATRYADIMSRILLGMLEA